MNDLANRTGSGPGDRRSGEVGGGPGGVELAQEQLAPLLLVALADATCGHGQAVQGTQEASVLRVLPADVAAAAPAVGPETVEPAVVPDAERGVGLDVVA